MVRICCRYRGSAPKNQGVRNIVRIARPFDFNSNFTVNAIVHCNGQARKEPFRLLGDFGANKGFEMMTQNNKQARARLADRIDRPPSPRLTSRFLHTSPAFKVVQEIPAHLGELLKRLEEAEADNKPQAHGSARNASL
jgi:hypothetical protein